MTLKYLRKRHIILDMDTNEREDLRTVNKAKKRSRQLQQANGGLGRGNLQVVDKFPEVEDA